MSKPTYADMDNYLADLLYDEDDPGVKAILKAIRKVLEKYAKPEPGKVRS